MALKVISGGPKIIKKRMERRPLGNVVSFCQKFKIQKSNQRKPTIKETIIFFHLTLKFGKKERRQLVIE